MTRTGAYATTEWVHRLECGHVERRKRRAPQTHIGCAMCVEEERSRARTLHAELVLKDELPVVDDAAIETKAAQIAAEIAARLRVQVEMVDVRLVDAGGRLKVDGATVYVPADVALSLIAS